MTPETGKFKIGDIVQLRTGGPRMVIDAYVVKGLDIGAINPGETRQSDEPQYE